LDLHSDDAVSSACLRLQSVNVEIGQSSIGKRRREMALLTIIRQVFHVPSTRV